MTQEPKSAESLQISLKSVLHANFSRTVSEQFSGDRLPGEISKDVSFLWGEVNDMVRRVSLPVSIYTLWNTR